MCITEVQYDTQLACGNIHLKQIRITEKQSCSVLSYYALVHDISNSNSNRNCAW